MLDFALHAIVRSMRSFLLVLCLAPLLQACGLRGPLYLPTPEEKREQAQRRERLEERERAERSNPPAPGPESTEAPLPSSPGAPAPERPRPDKPPAERPQPPPVQ